MNEMSRFLLLISLILLITLVTGMIMFASMRHRPVVTERYEAKGEALSNALPFALVGDSNIGVDVGWSNETGNPFLWIGPKAADNMTVNVGITACNDARFLRGLGTREVKGLGSGDLRVYGQGNLDLDAGGWLRVNACNVAFGARPEFRDGVSLGGIGIITRPTGGGVRFVGKDGAAFFDVAPESGGVLTVGNEKSGETSCVRGASGDASGSVCFRNGMVETRGMLYAPAGLNASGGMSVSGLGMGMCNVALEPGVVERDAKGTEVVVKNKRYLLLDADGVMLKKDGRIVGEGGDSIKIGKFELKSSGDKLMIMKDSKPVVSVDASDPDENGLNMYNSRDAKKYMRVSSSSRQIMRVLDDDAAAKTATAGDGEGDG